jgi:hypothetical protein
MKPLRIGSAFLLVQAFARASEATLTGTPLPTPLESYHDPVGAGLWNVLGQRAAADPINLAALVIFACAIVHTFLTARIRHWAHAVEARHAARLADRPATAPADREVEEVSFPGQILHFLSEIEVVFGFWVVVLAGAITWLRGWNSVVTYVGRTVSFTEPLFVVIIMALASTRPVLKFAEACLRRVAGLGRGTPGAWWLSILILAPLLGSFITEPAAITIAALLLSRQFYALKPSPRLRYATLGLLFVNISVGGTLTHFAAPPVIMVAGAWHWGLVHMLMHFGWKAAIGVGISTVAYYFVFRRELAALRAGPDAGGGHRDGAPVPAWVVAVHLAFVAFTVWQAHYPVLFIGGFLFFLAFTQATAHHQSPLDLRAPVLVGFFLAGLVIHGGLQAWWIQPILGRLGELPLFLGATLLTAFNDNAAVTYLASLVPDFSDALKFAVVAGAVTGGGLTVIANAPNPAGQSILARYFPDGVSPLGLAVSALPATVIVAVCFLAL